MNGVCGVVGGGGDEGGTATGRREQTGVWGRAPAGCGAAPRGENFVFFDAQFNFSLDLEMVCFSLKLISKLNQQYPTSSIIILPSTTQQSPESHMIA